MTYKYYDSPEGKDCLLKTLVVSKLGLYAGGLYAVHDMIFISYPKTALQVLGRLGYIATPFVLSAATFASFTCILNQVRKKDDKLNYFIGGLAAGAVFGARFKSPFLTTLGMVFCGSGALAQKIAHDNGLTLFPTFKTPAYGSVYYPKQDWSGVLVKDVPRK